MTRRPAVVALVAACLGACVGAFPAHAAETIGKTFPADFPVIEDASLGVPVIGFGSSVGDVRRTPVIFLHGNNDTPYPIPVCNEPYGKVQAMAQHFLDGGYAPKELWALGYQGDQCDLLTDETRRAKEPHSTVANLPDLRAFVHAVLDYTGAKQVDIVGHSLGTTLAREWMRADNAYAMVRRLVGVDGPNHGIINCSPSPQNWYVTIGFTPDSPVCLEYGAADTPLLARLNTGDETPGPTEYLVLMNADTSFVYIAEQDGVMAPVPAEDRHGNPHDFSQSARLAGAKVIEFTEQGQYDQALLASHTGIINSPDVWAAAFAFLTAKAAPPQAAPTTRPVPAAPQPPAGRPLPATGLDAAWLAGAALLVAGAVTVRRRLRVS